MTTDGPAALRRLVYLPHGKLVEGVINAAAMWEAEREQAAADRAALAQAQHANDAERGEWSEYYALLTGDRGAWSPDDMRRAVKAQTDALAQARALLADYEAHCQRTPDGDLILRGNDVDALLAVLGGAR